MYWYFPGKSILKGKICTYSLLGDLWAACYLSNSVLRYPLVSLTCSFVQVCRQASIPILCRKCGYLLRRDDSEFIASHPPWSRAVHTVLPQSTVAGLCIYKINGTFLLEVVLTNKTTVARQSLLICQMQNVWTKSVIHTCYALGTREAQQVH